jgi:hypothetical protein
MFVDRNGALVCPELGLPTHLEVHCRVAQGSHVADQLHLTFPTPIQCLVYAILESSHKLQ